MKKFNVERFKNASVRERLRQALEYKRGIDDFVNKQSGGTRAALRQASLDADTWIEMMFGLAQAIDNFESNATLARDRKALPGMLETLRRRLAAETDPDRKAGLQNELDTGQKLLDNLQSVEAKVTQADSMIDNTLDQLRKVYTTLQSRPRLN